MAINILIAIATRHKLLHAILMQKVMFLSKRELCQTHKICYKCLTCNICNLYIKYTISGLTIFPAIGATFTDLNRDRNSWKMNYSSCMTDVYERLYSCRQCWASKCRCL
jgi:hypothetical protein